ncbi:hypothetical protein E2C01_073310 [Portunus trituberculatus]|uniref:Uncharacterized protein n=1 Tax=Portunus trituberculatus TaxID=210409 RepID=A0A5B7I504_PORTR|nr:hypothetical protein [Portunus trituberculatus]
MGRGSSDPRPHGSVTWRLISRKIRGCITRAAWHWVGVGA